MLTTDELFELFATGDNAALVAEFTDAGFVTASLSAKNTSGQTAIQYLFDSVADPTAQLDVVLNANVNAGAAGDGVAARLREVFIAQNDLDRTIFHNLSLSEYDQSAFISKIYEFVTTEALQTEIFALTDTNGDNALDLLFVEGESANIKATIDVMDATTLTTTLALLDASVLTDATLPDTSIAWTRFLDAFDLTNIAGLSTILTSSDSNGVKILNALMSSTEDNTDTMKNIMKESDYVEATVTSWFDTSDLGAQTVYATHVDIVEPTLLPSAAVYVYVEKLRADAFALPCTDNHPGQDCEIRLTALKNIPTRGVNPIEALNEEINTAQLAFDTATSLTEGRKDTLATKVSESYNLLLLKETLDAIKLAVDAMTAPQLILKISDKTGGQYFTDSALFENVKTAYTLHETVKVSEACTDVGLGFQALLLCTINLPMVTETSNPSTNKGSHWSNIVFQDIGAGDTMIDTTTTAKTDLLATSVDPLHLKIDTLIAVEATVEAVCIEADVTHPDACDNIISIGSLDVGTLFA